MAQMDASSVYRVQFLVLQLQTMILTFDKSSNIKIHGCPEANAVYGYKDVMSPEKNSSHLQMLNSCNQ